MHVTRRQEHMREWWKSEQEVRVIGYDDQEETTNKRHDQGRSDRRQPGKGLVDVNSIESV